MQIELKPCPFCGVKAMIQQHRVNGDERFTHSWIFCIGCFNQTRQYLSLNTAAEAWNRRAKDADVTDMNVGKMEEEE